MLTHNRLAKWVRFKLGLTNHQILVDIVGRCSLFCPSCPVGVQESRDGHRMSIDTFRRILDKLQFEDKVRIYKVQLYRWSDPLLHKDLHEFILECNRRGLRASTSSVLQAMNCDLDKVIESEPAEFRASFSGWEKMHIYQKGARPEKFIRNLERVSKMNVSPKTDLVMFFHRYKQNLHEEAPAKRLAEDNGFRFVAFEATYMMYDRIIENHFGERPYSDEDLKTINMMPESPEENIARFKVPPSEKDYCEVQMEEITLDSYGNVQQCQMMYEEKHRKGNVLDRPMKEIRKEIMNNPLCLKCKATGIPRYTQIFSDPKLDVDPKKVADEGKYAKELILQ